MDDIKPIKIVAMGQSLASGLFSSYEDRSNVGMRALVQNFEGRAAVPAQFENAAIPNTPLRQTLDNKGSANIMFKCSKT